MGDAAIGSLFPSTDSKIKKLELEKRKLGLQALVSVLGRRPRISDDKDLSDLRMGALLAGSALGANKLIAEEIIDVTPRRKGFSLAKIVIGGKPMTKTKETTKMRSLVKLLTKGR